MKTPKTRKLVLSPSLARIHFSIARTQGAILRIQAACCGLRFETKSPAIAEIAKAIGAASAKATMAMAEKHKTAIRMRLSANAPRALSARSSRVRPKPSICGFFFTNAT